MSCQVWSTARMSGFLWKTVTATTPLRFFVLTSRGFWSLIEHSPGVERKVLRALAKRLAPSDPTL